MKKQTLTAHKICILSHDIYCLFKARFKSQGSKLFKRFKSLLLTKAAFIWSKYSKKHNIENHYTFKSPFFVNICLNVIYSCDQSCIFSIITPVFSHMIFRNHSDMLIYCSRNMYYYRYYQCWKQLHISVKDSEWIEMTKFKRAAFCDQFNASLLNKSIRFFWKILWMIV